jgi:hypothetical protein
MLKLTTTRQSEPGAGHNLGIRLDIRNDGVDVGKLAYDQRRVRGEFNLGAVRFAVTGDPEQDPGQKVVSSWAQPNGPPAFTLRADDDTPLARAERDRDIYVLDYAGESFILEAGRSRRFFHLKREGDAEVLGRVGQRKFWTTGLEADLPPGFATCVQVFLVILLLDLMKARGLATA